MIATDRIYRQWDDEIVPRLVDYIRIPAKSPHFDPSWEAHGHIERVVALADAWARAQPVTGLAVEVIRLPGRTPLLYFEAPGRSDRTVLLYGHLDKQPEMVGWRADGGPWMPVLENGKLYGRGGADDGYAIFAALSALVALDAQRLPRARCVGLIETCEESGSYDLPAYLEALAPRIGNVDLVVGLDTFKPVTVADPTEHRMHSERYRVPAATLEACRSARRVVAIGTTTVRALEAAAATDDPSGRTTLFVRRPYEWRVVDVLLTNFHLPRTTLLMMIDAFIGPRWRELYDTALAADYRFLSFGDAMLLERTA